MRESSASVTTTGSPLGSNAQRVLASGGLFLVAGGMLFGLVFAIFILHPNNARIGDAMFAAAQLVPSGDTDGILSRFESIGGFLENKGTKIDTHSHMVHMGFIALLLALLQPWVVLSDKTRSLSARLYIVSAVLLPPAIFSIHYLGLAYSPLSFIGWGSILADLSGALLAIAVSIQLWGLLKFGRAGKVPAAVALPEGGRAARLLLAGGALLLACGFVYGAAYAAWTQGGHAPSELAILKSIVSSAAADDQAALGESFGQFGRWQMIQAINVATHSHVNEMGILLLLLSFLQGLVAFEERVRVRWAGLAVTGAFLLPVGILLEIPFGVVGSVIADLAGFTAIVSLLAMSIGLLRHYRGRSTRELGPG